MCKVKGYKPRCVASVGGMNKLLIGNAYDFVFTEGAVDSDGEATGYNAIALRSVGSGATATATVSGGAVASVAVTAGGTLYQSGTVTVVFTGGGGSGATATATVIGGVITAISIVNGGTLYTTAPTVAIYGGANAAIGSGLYEVDFYENTGILECTQDAGEGSASWAYDVKAKLLKTGQKLTNFLTTLDSLSLCCQILYVAVMNDGSIQVFGEKYVGTTELIDFKIKQSGTKTTTGAEFKSFNGAELNLKGDFNRPTYEFTGGLAAITGFLAN